MSVSNEINRIKTNIANAYTELEIKGATIPTNKNSNNLATTINSIPSGSGASINGTIEQKTIIGNVSKGDFVSATEQNKTTRILNVNNVYYEGDNQNSSYPMVNMLDENPNTYFLAGKSGSYGSFYVKTKFPTYIDLGIPKDSLILECKLDITHRCTSNNLPDSIQSHFYKYTNFSSGTGTVLNRKDLTKTSSLTTDTDYVTFMFKAEELENYGFTIYGYRSSLGVYIGIYDFVLTITYLDNGKVKTASLPTDSIVGVANSDGTDGSTIDVYVPNV